MSNECCIKNNKDACDHSNIPITCNMDKCNDDLTHNGKFCCSGEAEFNGGKYWCKTKTPPPPPKRTCANPGEDVTKSDIFKTIPAPCCDGQKPVNNICPDTPKPPPGNSGDNKMGLKVLLGILIFLWFVTLGVFIYTKYKIGK
tara:strand:- start:1980 stop:2408 length:429 start_codon:yes stop_codon:yes gene_type:complete